MNVDSVDYLLQHIESDDFDESLYGHLCNINLQGVRAKVRALERLEAVTYKAGKSWKSKKSFESDKSSRKGRIFESLAGDILKGIKCFEIHQNVHSSTNEVDILVLLKPSSQLVPALRLWGTHLICECKFHQTHISVTWVDKLRGVMGKHGSEVSILISKKGIAKTGPGVSIKHTLQLYAAMTPSAFILPIDFDDINQCLKGENFLKLLNKRHVEIRAATAKLTAAIV